MILDDDSVSTATHTATGATPAATDKEVLTVAEAAAYLDLGKNQLYDAIARGDIPHRRIGKTIRLSRSVLLRWLAGAA